MSLKKISSFISDFSTLFYPELCSGCSRSLNSNEQSLCLHCVEGLPLTEFHISESNLIDKLFFGTDVVEHGFSLLYFYKKGIAQTIIHRLKYHEDLDVGLVLGRMIGEKWISSNCKNPDFIIPVPLHARKEKIRGYNQCHSIAKGVNEVIESEIDFNSLQRMLYNNSQTVKSRYDRWKNTNGVFELNDSEKFEGKHILLIDDVITTGATMSACISAIVKEVNCTISIATIAVSQ